jgi:hypothetical protein
MDNRSVLDVVPNCDDKDEEKKLIKNKKYACFLILFYRNPFY